MENKNEKMQAPTGGKPAGGKSRRFSLGRLLMVLGVCLIVVGAGYEAINYPWGYLLGKVGIESNDSLPDPAPLDVPFKYYYQEAAQPVQAAETLPADNSGLSLTRPALNDPLVMGYIKIPKIGLSENILEGVGDEILYGVGHMPGTAAPGAEGNCVLAGHRNYIQMHPFKHLPKVETGDEVVLEVGDTRYLYEVYETFTVQPDEVWVTGPVEGDSVLTLITCTPVPTYSQRLIVKARLVREESVIDQM